MSKMRIYILVAVAAAAIGLGGTFGASAVPMNGNLGPIDIQDSQRE